MRVYRLVEREHHPPQCSCGMCDNTACEAVIRHAVNCSCSKCNAFLGPRPAIHHDEEGDLCDCWHPDRHRQTCGQLVGR